MMVRTDDDLAFLRAYLDQLREGCDGFDRMDPAHFNVVEVNGSSDTGTTSVEEERCARLADALGFDGDIFRDLYYQRSSHEARIQQRRIAVLSRLVDKLESHSFSRKNMDLTSDHVQILRFLAQQKVLTKQLDIEVAVQRCRKTVGKRLRELRSYGLVARPRGQRTGETITDAGRQILGEL